MIINHFHKKGFTLGLVLKQRLAASLKWPIIGPAKVSSADSLIVSNQEYTIMTPTRVESGGGGALPYINYIGMCHCEEIIGFSNTRKLL